ncbi:MULTISPECIES: macrolide family glycosyltransferase [Paenibacillus]|uniref:MGT family glycosyltransferase n=1 Tax=Paenibacillus pabuli TaxID=1472 RepID=A0A855Y012_9BACL|nr:MULTISPECIES: macrolide family glycosyltransferase [Paenibacillus]PWW34421.1 MGT family glycosyltransferase [Paenibacillus pabuli]PXW00842.1 MGT family glycosyltransferase [Paenibacillus taichungensis]RAI98210.1 MGT family glycosyltransferase [Paenibacillus pabuli]
MARVLVVITPAEGHVNPSLGLVTQLRNNGEEVVYVCTEEYRSRIEQSGAQLITYPFPQDAFSHDPVLKPQEYKHSYQFIYMMVGGIIRRVIPAVLRAIEHQKFDYLIFDSLMGWGGTILAEKLGIPAVCSIASFAFAEPLGSGQDLNEKDDADTMELYEATMKITRELAQEFQVNIPAMEEIPAHAGRLKLVYTSRYFQPQAEKLDDSFIFTGPSIIPRQDAPTFSFELLLERYPQTVYIAMGTILNKNLDFYQLCFEAFGDLPMNVVLSSGRYTDMEPLADRIPSNFIIKPYIAQLDMLQHTDVFITHAGMNSTSEALYYNVPLVMIPLTSDQPLVANRVEELGAGITLDKHNLSPTGLREALAEVLSNPYYKQQAYLIGESLRQAGGYKRAADMIMNHFAKV